MRSCFTLGSGVIILWSQIFLWSQVTGAEELRDCTAQEGADKKIECLQNSMLSLQKQLEGRTVQTGSVTFGQDQKDSPDWTFQELPPAGAMNWTSAPVLFSKPFATKPTVQVAIAGIYSSPNANFDKFGFLLEPAGVNETGFKVRIQRTQGLLYRVTVNWIAYGDQKP